MTVTSLHSRTITALFDTRDAADRAIDDLEAAGIPRQHTSVLEPNGSTAGSGEPEGFWQSLKNLFLPEEDRHSYAEGLRRGGFMVSVETDEANYNRVLDILDREGAANLDEREEAWRTDGWTGYRLPTATSPELTNPVEAAPVEAAMPGASLGADTGGFATADQRSGLRDAAQVRSRVRSYSVDNSMASATTNFVSSQIVEHMDVISADGQKIGTVDHLDGPDRIKLARTTSPDGQHHYVPFTWIDHVDQHVHLKKTLADIKAGA